MKERIDEIRGLIRNYLNKARLDELLMKLDALKALVSDPIAQLELGQLDEHQISRLTDLIGRESRRLIEIQRAEWQRVKDAERSAQDVADYNTRCANVATTLAKVTGAE